MYNVRVIEYPTGFQVRVYEYDVDYLMCKYLASDDKDKKERKKRIREQIERVQWENGWHDVDLDWDEFDEYFERQERDRKDDYAKHAALRAKKNLYYIARSNVWEWFVTFTLDKRKIERFDYDELSKRIKKWLNNLKQRKAPDLYYLIVPEQHKNGAWHFHGLLGGCDGLNFVDSGRWTGDKDNRKKIYNLGDFDYGFTECTKVESTERISSYICKYITKTMCAATAGKNRYWVSKTCKRAPVTDKWLSDVDLWELKERLYEKMSYKSRSNGEWCSVDYFEIPKGVDASEFL